MNGEPDANLTGSFWAKTTEDGLLGISVRDHCLNVGAVAEALRARLPTLLQHFAIEGGTALIAAHDVGKISAGFQIKCPKWLDNHGLAQRALRSGWSKSESNHAAVSQDHIFDRLPKGKTGRWAIAVGGHHGRFLGKGRVSRHEMERDWMQAERQALVEELEAVFGALPDTAPESDAHLLFVAGWMTVSDWIGSNEHFFPVDRTYDPDDSRADAEKAVHSIDWGRGKLHPDRPFSELFAGFQPNALQAACLNQIRHPGLHLIEAPMGAGKTEAALAAAYQLIDAGHHHGIYFALPTQLTSNRVHGRMKDFLNKGLAEPTDHPLAHANSWLQQDLRIKLRPAARDEDESYPGEHSHTGRSWFASPKHSLLARYGVGTIDQALLGILAAKYCAVRLFGLAGKVVILDEVHSYDAYMSRLIDLLITRLLELRCSVLVLSATLTSRRRQELLAVAGAQSVEAETAYPLLSSSGGGNGTVTTSTPAAPDFGPDRVQVRRWESEEPLLDAACEAAEQGACVLVIRNTVDSAQASHDYLCGARCEGGPEIGLLHSRFPQFVREDKEGKWMTRLGRDGSERPRGCVLVATQVVEQSVDIDADLLVSDLAPTDMLLQRLGRLWRHRRESRPRDRAELWLLQPEIPATADARELRNSLGKSACVYPPYVLLRSAEVWNQTDEVKLPNDIRPLLESTYRERDSATEPNGWQPLRTQLEKLTNKMKNVAFQRSHILGNEALRDEEGMQTRWKDFPTADLVLLAKSPSEGSDDIQIQFLNDRRHSASAFEWLFPVAAEIHRNLARVPLYTVRGALDGEAQPDWLRLHARGAVYGVVEPDGLVRIPGNDDAFTLRYHKETGIRISRAKSTPESDWNEDDESWF